MSINYKKTVTVFEGHCEIEDAETLLAWILDHPKGKLNLKKLTQLHTAVLQVLLALKPCISTWPENEELTDWLQRILTLEMENEL